MFELRSPKIKQTILNTTRATAFVWRAAPRWTVANIMLLFIQALLPLALLYLTKLIVDAISASLATSEATAAWSRVLPLLLAAGGLTILHTAIESLATLAKTAQGEKVTDYMQGVLYAKSIEIDLAHYESPQYHDILERARKEAPYRPTKILYHLTSLGQNSISMVAMVGLLLSLHWGMAGVLFVSAIPVLLVQLKYSGVLYRWHKQNTALERQAQYRGHLLSAERSAKELRLFNLGQHFLQQFHHIRRTIYKERLAIAIKWSAGTLSAQACARLLVFAVYSFAVYQTVHSIIGLGDLVLYHQALKRGQDALQGVISGGSGLYEDNLFLSNLYEYLALQPQVADPIQPQIVPVPMRSGIVFNNVDFSYESTSRQALKQINLTINTGETVAFVGENGSGKTTLVKLLCRLYDPTSGCITLDGINLQNFAVAPLRRQISAVFQDYAKYHLTARDNIRLGRIESEPNHPSISKAAYYSGADAVIKTLPQQYDTVLGKWFEEGEELSIGQWQKIALARALTREAQIVVLDEPTSAMDPKAESALFEQFQQLIQNRTAVLISHRLSTVKMADRIFVMAHGKIVERGTHNQLMANQGVYADLFEAQAQRYR